MDSLKDLVRGIFRNELESIQAHLDGCILGEDPIHLHDLRVANRRTRIALEVFKDLIPTDVYGGYKKDFRWIQAISGEVRDLDVSLIYLSGYKKELPKDWRKQLQPLEDILREKREQAQAILSKELASKRMSKILDGWSEVLSSDQIQEGSGPSVSAAETGCLMIIKRYQKVQNKGAKLSKKTPAKTFHSFRIQIKRLRYLMEFFQPLVENEDFKRLRRSLKSVQDAFGAYQDTDVQRERILELAQELHQKGTPTDTLLASGQLVGLLEKKLRRNRKLCLRQVRWLVTDKTAREFQSCFKYPLV